MGLVRRGGMKRRDEWRRADSVEEDKRKWGGFGVEANEQGAVGEGSGRLLGSMAEGV